MLDINLYLSGAAKTVAKSAKTFFSNIVLSGVLVHAWTPSSYAISSYM